MRRQVDRGDQPGRFILTGSATPLDAQGTHSGAGRIMSVRMRPMALHERELTTPTVSFSQLLNGNLSSVSGMCSLTLEDYFEAIVSSGFPEIQGVSETFREEFLDSYLLRIVDRDLPELGLKLRSTYSLQRWLKAYAATTSSTTSYSNLLDASTGGDGFQLQKATMLNYRDYLSRIWILDELPAWLPTKNEFKRLTQSPKHHLADPALAARLLNLNQSKLVTSEGAHMVGALFESLVTLGVRTLAQANRASVGDLRTMGGRQEIDLVVTGSAGQLLAIEVKLASSIQNADVKHLLWLREQLPNTPVTCVVISTGAGAYVRPDGIAVVPLGLLGL